MKIKNTELVNISKKNIIYISPEYGYSSKINNYAGGLGILAGDFLKEASDQNVSITAFGLFYREGYFIQSFDDEFNQLSGIDNIDEKMLDFKNILDNGEIKIFSIRLNGSIIKFKVRQTNIKNISLYLIDTNVKDNLSFENVTDMLYTSSRYTRLLQEILLGQGAIKILEFLDITIDILHINEGHAAFAFLERVNQLADKINNFNQALQIIKKSNIFTTHTPIIHGNEEFDIRLLKEILTNSDLLRHIRFNRFIELGATLENTNFSMTALSIRLSKIHNTVSKLHNKVAQRIWSNTFKDIEFANVTNGVYLKDWMPEQFTPFLMQDGTQKQSNIINIKHALKNKALSNLIQHNFYNKSQSLLSLYQNVDIPNHSFIIGFARRFAPYKRTELLFSDIDNLISFFDRNNNVILFISGKAHPADIEGQHIIKNILNDIKKHKLQENIIFIENYNIDIAKILFSITDIWLNNPIRGLEACGTSGMKASLNASINLSILDGWWDEAYDSKIGFKIGDICVNDLSNIELANQILLDIEEVLRIYNNSNAWNELIQNAFRKVSNDFTTARMLKEYLNLYQATI
ncbi:MAG TPA: alpha-glucan family phosphorylase [Candidatus Kapabacteria bacterium]|nr:alpha-glucan family phosphorylase [Candidatus Kapabacteria bacterium]